MALPQALTEGWVGLGRTGSSQCTVRRNEGQVIYPCKALTFGAVRTLLARVPVLLAGRVG